MNRKTMMKNKSIIFLDIDGVLNFPDKKGDRLSRGKISLLNDLCNSTNSDIVITSSWRKLYKLDDIKDTFLEHGADFKIIGMTPHSSTGIRGVEIHEWMKNHIYETYEYDYFNFFRYAIIDDDSDMLLNQREHFFHVDTSHGLTKNTVYKIDKFLKSRQNVGRHNVNQFTLKKIDNAHILGVFFEGKFMGQYIDIRSLPKQFHQCSGHDDQLYDVNLSLEFMKTKTDNELKIESGWSTKTQQWFSIKEVLVQEGV